MTLAEAAARVDAGAATGVLENSRLPLSLAVHAVMPMALSVSTAAKRMASSMQGEDASDDVMAPGTTA